MFHSRYLWLRSLIHPLTLSLEFNHCEKNEYETKNINNNGNIAFYSVQYRYMYAVAVVELANRQS